MQVNCILEAFGHAKTQRNSNSSRFTKLLTVQYCDKRRTLLRGKLVVPLFSPFFISYSLYSFICMQSLYYT